MSEDNKEIVRRWFDEVWNKGRTEAIEQMFAPDAIVHGLGDDLHGPAGFKPFHAGYRAAFPDMKITVDDMVAEGDKVAFRWTVVATQSGPLMGMPATGKQVRFTGMGLIRTENGQVTEGWNTFDQLGMLQQLGMVAAPQQAF